MTRMTEIDGTEKIYDSRDIIARIEKLEEERTGLVEAMGEAERGLRDCELTGVGDAESAQIAFDEATHALEEWDSEYLNPTIHIDGDGRKTESGGGELWELRRLADDFGGYGDWEHGEALIREDHFQDYAEELAEDCCEMPRDMAGRWPYCHIDWEAAAEALKMDYTTAEAFGHTWYMRA